MNDLPVEAAVGGGIRVLILADHAADAELLIHTLRQAGFEPQWQLVDGKVEYLVALDTSPDVVLADSHVPHFGALDALDVTHDRGLDVPFIVITGAHGDELAVECIRRGADDYLVKDRLHRLGAAVAQALERKQLRERARDAGTAAAWLAAIVQSSEDAVIGNDLNGVITSWNAGAEKIFGWSADEMVGSLVTRLIPPDRSVEEEQLLSRIKRGESMEQFETVRVGRGGRLIDVSITVSPIKDGQGALIGASKMVRDVTERNKARQALIESEQRFRQVAENIRDVFFLMESDSSRLHYVSPAYEEVWGRSCASLYAAPLSWADTIHPDDREYVFAKIAEGMATGFDHEYRIVRPDGDVRWIWIRGFPILDETGKPYRTAGVAADITERKEAEEKIRRLNRVHTVLSSINSLCARVRNRQQIFTEACNIAVEAGRFSLAWVSVVDRKAKQLRPVAWAGAEDGFLASAQRRFSLEDMPPEGHGPPARAALDQTAIVVNDVQSDPRILHKEDHQERNLHSVASLPLLIADEVVGVLTLHAAEAGIFDEAEMKLLAELAGNIAFALETIEKQEKLDYLSYYDLLTGLPNRALFMDRAGQQLRSRSGEARMVALILLNIERFRNVNETLGRRGGDELLKVVARRLESAFNGKDSLARISADTFGVVIRGIQDTATVVHAIEDRVQGCFKDIYALHDNELRVAARAGVAMFPADGEDADTLFKNAEAALKKARDSGERYLFYSADMNAQAAQTLSLETRLRAAVEKQQFVLHYQPKVKLPSGTMCGLEALIRWQEPGGRLVAPGVFIPVLEDTGLIHEVGKWALAQALAQHREWTARGFAAPRIAVNVSAIQLQRKDFADMVIGVVQDAGDDPDALELEVTESVMLKDMQASARKLSILRGLGIHIAMDDFGTGYSSLSYLARLPITSLKVDRSFIIGMSDNAHDMAIVRTIIALAKALKLRVVAEGVETADQMNSLTQLKCDEAQGYLFSKPLPAAEIEALARANARGTALREKI